ncbi:hypothetical protein JL721_1422 [Aureococcus anophagefferens]|nr:hypothetical protein JL721_1422 [Aureococcus anophagefferens]
MAETRGLLARLMRRSVVSDGRRRRRRRGRKLEAGWEKRGKSSSIRRNVEVWKALGGCALKVLKARKQGSEEKTAAATFARDKLLTLGPTFVKLGQVLSTRSDVLPPEYIDVLKSLQDDVPAFSGARAKEIVARELGVADVSEVFSAFGDEPIAAASLGQVHLGTLKKTGQRVAVKVQRAGLKDLFATDLKNLRKLCELLDKLDPKSDGADRSYIDVSVPTMYYEFSTPRVLTMEYIDSFKLTDIDRVEKEGLDRADLAKRIADSFLYQIVDTAYFHCDPHPGNLCVDTAGNLVYYDFGMMDELKPNVKDGFKEFCSALFEGGPMIDDIQLGVKAKQLVDAVETMGVLAKGADRLSCEQLARYFIRSFKDKQLGKKSEGPGIKSTLGTELQALTEAQVFRFPSTFTFIFRAVASIDGIGKGLDDKYDLGKFAQPFVERLVDRAKYGGDSTKKSLSIFSKATGLNAEDVNTALTSPKKIAYLEDTVRAIETGQLKIRVRSLENEMALTRLGTQSKATTSLLLSSLLLNVATVAELSLVPQVAVFALAAGAGASGLSALLSLSAFDKKAANPSGVQPVKRSVRLAPRVIVG